MPVRANAGLNIRDGGNTIRVPGAYRYALEHKCARNAMQAAPDYLTLADDGEVIAKWQRDIDTHKAALIAERDGQPVTVHSDMLPPNLPASFNNWPLARRSFVVKPDDTITLVARKRSA